MEKLYENMSLAERGERTLARKDGYLHYRQSVMLAGWYILIVGDTRVRLFPDKVALFEHVGERFG